MRGNGFIAIKRNVYALKRSGYVTAFPSDGGNPAYFFATDKGGPD